MLKDFLEDCSYLISQSRSRDDHPVLHSVFGKKDDENKKHILAVAIEGKRKIEKSS